MGQSIKKNLVFNVLLNISSVIFPLITAPYVSRVLEPSGVGIFSFSLTYADYFALFAILGIPTYGMREVAKLRHSTHDLTKLVSELMSISAISTIFVIMVFFLSVSIIDRLTENYIFFLIAGFGIYLAPFKINWLFQGKEEFEFITIRTLIIRVLSIVSLFVFVREKEDLIIYIIICISSNILADIWNFCKMRQYGIRPRFTLTGLSPHIKPLLILFASTIAISIYTMLDTLMLGFLSDYTQVGYYNSANHLTRAILVALGSISTVAVPRISYYIREKEYGKINQLINKSFSFISFVSFPIAIIVFCVAPIFVPLFFGSSFEGAVLPLRTMCPLFFVIAFNNLTGTQILIGLGHDKCFLYSMIVGATTNFLLNLVLIPFWGAIGASAASVVAETMVLLATIWFVSKKTRIKFDNKSDLYKSIGGATLLIPCFYIVFIFVEGWTLIFFFSLISVLFFLAFEKIVKNSSASLLLDIAKSTISKIK